MKRERSVFKKILACIGYVFVTIILLFSIFLLIQKTSSRENGNIVRAQDSSTYFRNINPNFSVDFVNGEYIRFESVDSGQNPFQETKQSLLQKVLEILGLGRKRMGLNLSLEEISYDESLSENSFVDKSEGISRNLELIQSGKDILSSDDTPVSKDTIVSRGVKKGIDVRYQIIEGKGLKEEIILNDIPEYTKDCNSGECILPANRFVFKLTLDEGLELKSSVTSIPGFPSGTQYIVDKEGNYFAHLLPEFAKDALGNKTSNLKVSISKTNIENEYIYELILDSKWLLSNERVFPVSIDPSIVHDSSLSFDMGSYERTVQDQTSTIKLNGSLSGEYISGPIELAENAILENISWDSFSSATGECEEPYSQLSLLLDEKFNDLKSEKSKCGEGSLEMNGGNFSKTFNINSSEGSYFSIEFWSYNRYRSLVTVEDIFNSSLGSLSLSQGKYVFKDNQGKEYFSNLIPKFNDWQQIAVVFDVNGSKILFYLDGEQEEIEFDFSSLRRLSSVTLGGDSSMFGYIDNLRVYERILTKYEIVSDSQYANLYLQYRTSSNGRDWSDWINKYEYAPESLEEDDNIYLYSDAEDFGNYSLLAFSHPSDKEGTVYLGKDSQSHRDQWISLAEGSGEVDLGTIEYIDLSFKPTELSSSCLLSIGGYNLSSSDQKISLQSGDEKVTSLDSYFLGSDNHIALKMEDDGWYLYLNGSLTNKALRASLSVGNYSIGSGCSDTNDAGVGTVHDVRISSQSEIEIEALSNLEDRKYTYTSSFIANLQENKKLESSEEKSIYIKQANTKTTNYIENLFIGEKIVIEENNYSIEGEITSVNKATGLVEVSDWSGDFPIEGFTNSARVYKWQREYIPIHEYLDLSDYTNGLSIKTTQDFQNIKDFEFLSPFSQLGNNDFSDSNRYIQYKYIFVSKIQGLTPYLSGVNINYTVDGPGMDQIMRHGSWFDENGKQPFWWAN